MNFFGQPIKKQEDYEIYQIYQIYQREIYQIFHVIKVIINSLVRYINKKKIFPQQINFTGKLEDHGATMHFLKRRKKLFLYISYL